MNDSDWDNEYFSDCEILPNGIYVRRKIKWHSSEIHSWPMGTPWLATIGVGSWHYSSKGEESRELAISQLLEYMKSQILDFKDRIKRDTERLEELNKFLATEENRHI